MLASSHILKDIDKPYNFMLTDCPCVATCNVYFRNMLLARVHNNIMNSCY